MRGWDFPAKFTMLALSFERLVVSSVSWQLAGLWVIMPIERAGSASV